MSDRRKARRFAFTKPAEARLHLLQDVVIEHSDADDSWSSRPRRALRAKNWRSAFGEPTGERHADGPYRSKAGL